MTTWEILQMEQGPWTTVHEKTINTPSEMFKLLSEIEEEEE